MRKNNNSWSARITVFLYTVGSIAAAGILISLFLLLYVFTDKDVLEILVVSAMISAAATIPMFVKLDDIAFSLKGWTDDRD